MKCDIHFSLFTESVRTQSAIQSSSMFSPFTTKKSVKIFTNALHKLSFVCFQKLFREENAITIRYLVMYVFIQFIPVKGRF